MRLGGVLYGLRFAAAVCIALWLAFDFELDEPWWAGTSAALVCQPVLGAALRKGVFRVIGTCAGAVAIVAIVAFFPQDRVGFTLALASWSAACCFVGSRLRNFSAYSAVLAGYTAAIIASDAADAPGQVFDIALARATEVLIGVAVATVVLALTDQGRSKERLAGSIRALATRALRGIAAANEAPAGLVKALADLGPIADQAIGERRYRGRGDQAIAAAFDGLFRCIAASRASGARALPERAASIREIVDRAQDRGGAAACLDAAATLPPAARDLADALDGAAVALDVADWLEQPTVSPQARQQDHAPPDDPLPALLSAARAFACVGAVSFVWIETRWSSGPMAITFAIISVLLFSLQEETSARGAANFAASVLLAIAVAGVLKFAVLPQLEGFAALAAAITVTVAPMAALSTVPKFSVLGLATANLIPILAPTNEASYDTAAFYNSAVAIATGCVAGAVLLRLVPPLRRPTRIARLLRAARRDCDALRSRRWHPSEDGWCGRMRVRATRMPNPNDAEIGYFLGLYALGSRVLRSANGQNVGEAARRRRMEAGEAPA